MAALIGLVSQKGGVGKSTLARLVAREYAAAGWQVKIADLDISQGTSTDWKQRRERAGVKPDIAVEPFGTPARSLNSSWSTCEPVAGSLSQYLSHGFLSTAPEQLSEVLQ
jgi:Mrp family chromosome partitioning ATPase